MKTAQISGIEKLELVESTNSYLSKKLANHKIDEFFAVMTNFQTGGKGMGSNVWESDKGKNLLCSIVLKPKYLKAEHQFYISKLAAISVCELVEILSGSKNVKIKWPNDIYIGKKKAAGILIENSFIGNQIQYSILGIGVNINQKIFSDKLPNPTSIVLHSKKELPILEVLNTLLKIVKENYVLITNNELDKLDVIYNEKLLNIDKWSNYIVNNEVIRAKVVGTNEYGLLRLLKRNRAIDLYDIKEVKWII